MKCLYEVLQVIPTADDSEIRTAYRKLALQYHPDKNQANQAAAEERFKEVQNAYEILSDKQERAWYDAHRDAILRSGERHQAGAAGDDFGGVRPDDYVDVNEYFSSTCFSGFGDGPRGFYGVYSSVFETIARQEGTSLPSFGFSTAPWPEVASFYNAWSGFTSIKDFSWAAEYNPASAPNRRVRRVIERENEKQIKAARKEYNEGVRMLVEFVKKRDKRVVAHQAQEAKQRMERQAAEQKRREEEREARLKKAAEYKVAEWARDATSDDDDDDYLEDDQPQLIWHCPVCDKHFKSEAAISNHERSKKHREQVELLRYELEQEEELLCDGEHDDGGGSGGSGTTDDDHNAIHSEIEEESEEESEESEESEASDIASEQQSSSAAAAEDEEEEEMDEDAMLASMLNSRVSLHAIDSSSSSSSSDDEGNAKEDIEQHAPKARSDSNDGNDTDTDEDDWGSRHTSKKGGVGGAGGGKKKSRRKAPPPKPNQPAPQNTAAAPVAAAALPSKRDSKKMVGTQPVAPDQELRCAICGSVFPSRNQLFKHIKASGHAQLK